MIYFVIVKKFTLLLYYRNVSLSTQRPQIYLYLKSTEYWVWGKNIRCSAEV